MPPFDDLTITLFGKPGSGKTRFCAGDKSTMFVCTEPGAELLRARKWPVRDPKTGIWNPPTWQEFKQLVDQIGEKKQAGNLQIRSVTIDIIDNLYQACQDFICVDDRKRRGKEAIEHPSDMEDFGKTWGLVTKEWKSVLSKLMGLVRVRFVSHSEEQQVEIVNENNLKEKVGRISATFSGGKGGKCGQYLDGIVNAMGYIAQDGMGQHTVSFRQEASIGAKDRTDILAAMSPIVLPKNPNEGWEHVCDVYARKAKELGFEVKSLWR